MLRIAQTPRALLQLLTTVILLTPLPLHVAAKPQPHPSEQAGFTFNELFARYDCAGTTCGYTGQYCCGDGEACYTDAANVATCTANAGAGQAAITSNGNGGYWQYYTSTYVETDLVTRTTVMSSYVGGGGAASQPTAASGGGSLGCNFALNESPCNDICCASGQYCSNPGAAQGQCVAAAGGGSSGYYSTYAGMTSTNGATAGAPIRPTTSAGKTITTTSGPTTTVPFVTPVATGANITLTEDQMDGGGGLSGGAIAGIVIGVLIGLFLLFLLIACCCFKALLDTFLACFGCGRKKRRSRVEVEEYERHSHHSRHGGAGGAGRTWYGAAAKPTRVDRRDSHKKKELLGVGAGLAALWAVLGLKRKHDGRKNDEKYSEYSYSSDYYTSASKFCPPTTTALERGNGFTDF